MTTLKKINRKFNAFMINKYVKDVFFYLVLAMQYSGMYANYYASNYLTVIFHALMIVLFYTIRYLDSLYQDEFDKEYEKLNIWKTLSLMSNLVINEKENPTYLLVCPGFDTEQEYYFLWITDKDGTAISGGGYIYPETLQILLDHANTKSFSGKLHIDNSKNHLNETILQLLISTDTNKVKLGLNLYKKWK